MYSSYLRGSNQFHFVLITVLHLMAIPRKLFLCCAYIYTWTNTLDKETSHQMPILKANYERPTFTLPLLSASRQCCIMKGCVMPPQCNLWFQTALMSIDLLHAIKSFSLPFRANTDFALRLRIGLHSGSLTSSRPRCVITHMCEHECT